MAYLHCHTKGCGWSQDDFWDWEWTYKFWKFRAFGYNPLSCIIDNIRDYSYPRVVGKQFSWFVLFSENYRQIKKIFIQKWWKYESFKKDESAVCPKCKQKNFDID